MKEFLTPGRQFVLRDRGGEKKKRHISGSGSANVGDRGIGGLKPSLSAFA